MIAVGVMYHFFGTGQHMLAAQLSIFAMVLQIVQTLLLCSNWVFTEDSSDEKMTNEKW